MAAKNLTTLAVLLTLLSSSVYPQSVRPVYGVKEYNPQIAKVKDALGYVISFADDWRIFVISEKEWNAALPVNRRHHVAGTCWTIAVSKLTYCNVEWIKGTDVSTIAHTLRHEYGHILCQDHSEECADTRARFLAP